MTTRTDFEMNSSTKKGQAGFTLPELLIVMAILATLLAFITPSLLHFRQRSVLNTTVDTLMTDLKSQQTKAMVGDTEGRAASDLYGIHFDQTSYVLFHGMTYSTSEPTNFIINLDGSIEFDTASRAEIIFERGNGEIYNFSTGPDRVIIQDTTNGNMKTIIFNRYGVVTDIN